MKLLYTAVMDSSVNPLKHLPPAQRFQAMLLLSIMWTTIFCTAAGAWLWYGELLLAHILVLLGIFVTWLVFRRARNAKL